MITREEIEAKAEEFALNPSNVQRDYVFGWLISGLYGDSGLRDKLILKGGNALRKAYFPMTRFSNDLDFSSTGGLDGNILLSEFNAICRLAEARSGVRFDTARNQIADEMIIDRHRRVYKTRIYFQDFYGNAGHITLRVNVDVTEFDKIYLPVQARLLLHPYSDVSDCCHEIKVVKLEEALADKMKCLIQRRYSFDLFDLVYAVFINRELAVNRSEIVSTFLRKTIFEPSPLAAKNLLLGVPFDLMRSFWTTVVCPKISKLSFDDAVTLFRDGLAALFAPFSYGDAMQQAFFPAEIRNPILQAGSDMTLLQVTYDGVNRLIEPYSLVFKRRKDGIGQEYFYGWDRTGGRSSGVGIKAFLPWKVESVELTSEKFEPRFLGKLEKLAIERCKVTFHVLSRRARLVFWPPEGLSVSPRIPASCTKSNAHTAAGSSRERPHPRHWAGTRTTTETNVTDVRGFRFSNAVE